MAFSVQIGKLGIGYCIAAVLCILEQWDKPQLFLKETNLLLDEHREQFNEYVSNR